MSKNNRPRTELPPVPSIRWYETPPERLKNSHRESGIVAKLPLSPINTDKSGAVPKAVRTRIGIEQQDLQHGV
jgi:hypothetical protein